MSCISPVQIPSPQNPKAYIYVACGKCAWCREHKRNEWFVRFKEEAKRCLFTTFLTLTYDNEHLPDDGVCQSDCQKFFKILRKHGYRFKYFLASEYGSQTHRAHYHALIFHDELIDFQNYWRHGFVAALPAYEGSYKYVSKYLLKGSNVPLGYKKNFMLCSKRPAIGADFVTTFNNRERIEQSEFQVYTSESGVKLPLPRYYRKKFADLRPDLLDAEMKAQILDAMQDNFKYSIEKKKYYETYHTLDNFETYLHDIYFRDENRQREINLRSKL